MVEVTVDRNVATPTRDGVVLRADVWRPAGRGRHPVLLMRVPYGKESAQDATYAHPWWWASKGYVVIAQDTRGRWASDGEFVPFVTEGVDTVDAVTWAAEQPFSNGRVGMYGFSYAGLTQLHGAAQAPDALAAIAPAMAQADPYEGWTYRNGAFSLAFNVSWAALLAQDVARRHGDPPLEANMMAQFMSTPSIAGTLPLSDMPNMGADGPAPFFNEWLAHPRRDAYWTERDMTGRLNEVVAPAFVVAGLWDVFLDGSIAAYQAINSGAATDGSRLLIGPWAHVPWTPIVAQADHGPHAINRVNETQLEFFDNQLRDGDEPGGLPVRWFITGADAWEESHRWPPEAGPWQLFLGARRRANSVQGGGYLSDEPPGPQDPDVYVYDPAVPVPSVGGRSCCVEGVAPIGPMDQRPVELMNQVLVFTSPPLEGDRLVVGNVRFHLFAATSAVDTDWTIKLCEVDPYGRSTNVQETVQRAGHYVKLDGEAPIEPGVVTEFVVDIGTCCHLFRAGYRVRVQISSSNFPQWDRNLNTGTPIGNDSMSDRVVATQFVYHDADHPSRIVLPILE